MNRSQHKNLPHRLILLSSVQQSVCMDQQVQLYEGLFVADSFFISLFHWMFCYVVSFGFDDNNNWCKIHVTNNNNATCSVTVDKWHASRSMRDVELRPATSTKWLKYSPTIYKCLIQGCPFFEIKRSCIFFLPFKKYTTSILITTNKWRTRETDERKYRVYTRNVYYFNVTMPMN